jgi:hypothetical protein
MRAIAGLRSLAFVIAKAVIGGSSIADIDAMSIFALVVSPVAISPQRQHRRDVILIWSLKLMTLKANPRLSARSLPNVEARIPPEQARMPAAPVNGGGKMCQMAA